MEKQIRGKTFNNNQHAAMVGVPEGAQPLTESIQNVIKQDFYKKNEKIKK